MTSDEKREPTKKARKRAFDWEIGECRKRVGQLHEALQSKDMFKINQAFESVSVSMEYLEANDPRKEKNNEYS